MIKRKKETFKQKNVTHDKLIYLCLHILQKNCCNITIYCHMLKKEYIYSS